MRLKHQIMTAYRGLQSNRLRSLLTMLGIVIGITAMMLVMSLGRSAQALILRQLQGLGSKTVVVIPGRQPKGPSDAAQIFSDSLRHKDLEALQRKSNVPGLASVMPLLFGGVTAAAGKETYRLTVFGASEVMAKIFDLQIQEGSFFTAEEIKAKATVAVIGWKTKSELFGSDENVVGKKIKIKGTGYRVVGVIPPRGQVSFFNFDETALIPYTTAQEYIFGLPYYHRFIIEAADQTEIGQTVHDIQTTLRSNHGITDPDKDDFFVQTQADLTQRVSTITDVLTYFIALVAAISLVVGGIGIMNIMLVTVTERTREVGLRKALGATSRNILVQFLLESVMLTGLGGMVGIALGMSMSFLSSLALNRVFGLNLDFNFPITAATAGFLVSLAIGLLSGIYPASIAATKNPVDTLRYE